MNKRKLYESIMSNVAKEVKKVLNEDFFGDEYIKDQMVHYFDCGDADEAEQMYIDLKSGDSDAIEEAYQYIIDHDDDGYTADMEYDDIIRNIRRFTNIAWHTYMGNN